MGGANLKKKEAELKEEIKKLKTETEKQLNYAKEQMVFWSKKMQQLTGSVAMAKVILELKPKEKK